LPKLPSARAPKPPAEGLPTLPPAPAAAPNPPEPSAGPPRLPAPPQPTTEPPELPAPRAGKATEAEAKQLVTPVTGKATGAQPDAAVPQEARPKPAPVRRQAPSRKLEAGELVCGECGEGNAPTRKFCARCGESLAAARVVKASWWRRLLPRRGAKVRKSGDRPRRLGRGGRSGAGVFVSGAFKVARRVVAVVLLIGGILYGLIAPFRGWVNERAMAARSGVEDIFFPNYEPVHATETPVAPLQVRGFGVAQVVDGASDTIWAAPLGRAKEPVVRVRFGREIDLARLIVHNGQKESFKDRARARRLHLVFSTGRTTDVQVTDSPDPQTLEIDNGEGVTSVEIHVLTTFKSMAGNELAISELEFFEET